MPIPETAAMLAITMLAGSGIGLTEKGPLICALKGAISPFRMDKPVEAFVKESEKLLTAAVGRKGVTRGSLEVNVTACPGTAESALRANDRLPAEPLSSPVNIAVRKLVPAPPARDVYAIVPVTTSEIWLPVWVALPTVVTFVKVSKAAMLRAGGSGVLPMLVIVTGMDPAGPTAGTAVKTVFPPDCVATMASLGLVWPKSRIVSALAEVASASEAKPAIANLNSFKLMLLLLRLWRRFSLNLGKAS